MPAPASGQATFHNLHLTGTVALYTPLRFQSTVFTFLGIVLLLVGRAKLDWYNSTGSGIITFPLIFLSLSLFTHIVAAAHYTFTELAGVEWAPSDLRMRPDSLWRIAERLEDVKRPDARVLRVACGGAGLGMASGALLVARFPMCNKLMIAGVVMTFLTAAIHILLAVLPENEYRWTLTLGDEDRERQLRGGHVRLVDEEPDEEFIGLRSMSMV
ncbi:hypothetical protein MMC26_005887 [Xylographa opegraphella]|nr:hypothetical protein [Xylographa opegraphella]